MKPQTISAESHLLTSTKLIKRFWRFNLDEISNCDEQNLSEEQKPFTDHYSLDEHSSSFQFIFKFIEREYHKHNCLKELKNFWYSLHFPFFLQVDVRVSRFRCRRKTWFLHPLTVSHIPPLKWIEKTTRVISPTYTSSNFFNKNG